MAEPTKKSFQINSLLGQMFGVDREATIRADKCVTCQGAATEFRDEISRKEFRISGMCQKCQDSIFGG